MARQYRGTSPINFEKYQQLIETLNDNNARIVLQPQEQGDPAPPAQPPPPNHPHLRNLGLVGLGAGLMYYRKPILKLGQKVINYATDKFHHLFQPTNETETTQQLNRGAF